METPVQAVIYACQYKDRNGSGIAVERQIESCALLARARDWELTYPPLVDNDVSAYSGAKRPQFDALMAMIRAGKVDAVLVWHMDRACRRIADLVELVRIARDAKVRIASVAGDFDLASPVGQMFATILIAVAEYEAAHKGERQKAANLQAARSGQRRTACPRPFGYEEDRVTKRPAEAEAIGWAAGHLLGGGTIAAVVREWDRRGLRPAQSGQPWRRQSVVTILANPALAGLVSYNGEILHDEDGEPLRGSWDVIVPEASWRALRVLMEGRTNPRRARTLLGGLATCGCGAVIEASSSYHGERVYRCSPEAQGNGRASIRANLDTLAEDMVSGVISRSQLMAATKRANSRLDEITATLAANSDAAVLAPFAAGQRAAQVWDELDQPRQRGVIDALATITLHPAGRGARSFKAESVGLEWRRPHSLR